MNARFINPCGLDEPIICPLKLPPVSKATNLLSTYLQPKIKWTIYWLLYPQWLNKLSVAKLE